jgi:signal transduction histidine kinase/DNA-binding response OmpR family regulator
MHSITLLFLSLAIHLFTLQASAEQITVDPASGSQTLNSALLYLQDNKQSYQLEQIADNNSKLQLNWQTRLQLEENLLLQPGHYWIKGQLHNPLDKPQTVTLSTEYPGINSAALYSLDAEQTVTTLYKNTGSNHPFTNRPAPHRNLVTTISLPANSVSTLIWQIESRPIFQFRASLWQPEAFIEHDQQQQMLYGMLYGILIVMALYNLFLYLSTKQKSYIYYVLYVVSALYLIASDQGHTYQYFSPDLAWKKLTTYVLLYAFNICMFGQFCIYFLNLKQHSPLLLKIIRWLSAVFIILALLVAFNGSLSLVLLGITTASLIYIAALVAGIIVRRAGVISAGHFIIAIMILVFSIAANNMARLGLINSTALTENLSAFGTVLMLIFFSLALADLINQLQKENQENHRNMAKANEEKIKSRNELLHSQMDRIKLEQTASQAKMESRSKSGFLSTMSHEIRNPVQEISAMTGQLQATELDQHQNQWLNTIEQANQSLLVIINDLRDYAKFEAGEMDLVMANFNLETLIDDCVSTFSLRATEKELEFIADIEASIPPVLRGDATKLRRIIINLLSNAFKFTEQGNILLKVASTGKSAINCVELKFTVKDTGIGLTSEEQKRLFSPFQHSDESSYEQFGGSGLGLSISKQLAELMDGAIGVESESGNGAEFWFTARLIVDQNPDATLLREKSDQLTGKKLLLVDAHHASTDILIRLLKSWGLQVVDCESVHDAINQLALNQQKHPFDIVLADYYLINEDSLAIARYLQQQQQINTSMVLMVTSRSLSSQTSLNNNSIKIVLEKPVTNALLHDSLIQAVTSSSDIAEMANQLSIDPAKLKVLVAEDNTVNQLVITGLLKKLGIEPDIASNGLEALNCYEQQDYDLILMDCEMPEMDGYEASKQIRSKEQHSGRKRVMIVALSAHARSDYLSHAQQVGMDKCMTKPIPSSEMIALLNQLGH